MSNFVLKEKFRGMQATDFRRVSVTLIFGVEATDNGNHLDQGYQRGDKGHLVPLSIDAMPSIASPDAQQWILHTCADARAQARHAATRIHAKARAGGYLRAACCFI